MNNCFTPISNNCDLCFEIEVDSCDDLNVSAGLVPATAYFLVMQDVQGNQAQDSIVINGDGSFDIDFSQFPNGFNQYGGDYEFVLSLTSDPITPVDFSISAITYNCLLLSFTVCCDGSGQTFDECNDLAPLISEDQLICLLPLYNMCDPNVTDNLTATQITCLTDLLCTSDITALLNAATQTEATDSIQASNKIAYVRPINGQKVQSEPNDSGDHNTRGTYTYLQQGRAPILDPADFTKLKSILVLGVESNFNIFGTLDRFTNDLGGTTYDGSGGETVNYVLDNYTGLGWKRTSEASMNLAPALVLAEASTFGGFSDWRMANLQEYVSIFPVGNNVSRILNYAPWSTTTESVWCSTRSTSSSYFFWIDRGRWFTITSSASKPYWIVRNHFV